MEVIDRTTGEIVPTDKWEFDEATGEVEIQTKAYHEYTVSFLAFLIWDPVHMYNFITNDWQDTPHQLTYDVRQPKTQKYVKEKLKRWCEENPNIDVVRFTTFFHQFTLTFDDQKREKYVEWFGYSASVSPYILEKFEKWAGYKFRPEFIVDQDITTVCSAYRAKNSVTLLNSSRLKFVHLRKSWLILFILMEKKL